MTDEITLVLPSERPFHGIAHLVLGGLAVRLDLTFEHLEDLQLALGGVLDRYDGGGEVTVEVHVEEQALRTRIGPFVGDSLRKELEREPGDELSLRRLLDTVVDGVELSEDGQWIELTKSIERDAGG